MLIRRSEKFKKAYKERIQKSPRLKDLFWEAEEIFRHNPFDPVLRTHSLTGELSDLWAFSVDSDCRVIFHFVNEQEVVFLNVGTHEEVY